MEGTPYSISDGFDRIAPHYDRANDAMSGGLHRLWRRRLCALAAELAPLGARVLDVATGTGDVLVDLVRRCPDIMVTGIDPSAEMLRMAREKIAQSKWTQCRPVALERGDCRNLPFGGEHFDVVTISWGIRNVQPFEDGLREIHRVLRPGGAVVILESGIPESFLVRAAYSLYKRALPLIGGWVSGYKPAYEFYRDSVDRFPCGPDFVRAMTEAGFEQPHYEPLFGGLSYLYAGLKSVDAPPPASEAEPSADLSAKVLIGDFAGTTQSSQLDRLAA